MNTRQSKKPKWSRQIPKKEWDHQTFDALAFDLFTAISTAMETDNPTWPAEKINEYINWKNENKQKDPTAPLQLQGPYSGYTLSLSFCKTSVLAERIGQEILPTIRKAWVTVAPSGIKNAGLGLFAATRFYENNIVTIYFTPNKSKEPTTNPKFMV